MVFYYILAALLGLIGLWYLMIAVLGLIPKIRATTVGVLTKANTYKKVKARYGTIPFLTEYEYSYKVNGKEYKYSTFGYHRKNILMRKVSIVYVKWCPKHAYPNKFTGLKEWILGIGWLIIGAMFIYAITKTYFG